ncbi:hypothetical protein AC781_09885 [Akkermansia glycaniphila]|nr:hypothetical protein AC781_09885 [Akkermansia glycaniphila]
MTPRLLIPNIMDNPVRGRLIHDRLFLSRRFFGKFIGSALMVLVVPFAGKELPPVLTCNIQNILIMLDKTIIPSKIQQTAFELYFTESFQIHQKNACIETVQRIFDALLHNGLMPFLMPRRIDPISSDFLDAGDEVTFQITSVQQSRIVHNEQIAIQIEYGIVILQQT